MMEENFINALKLCVVTADTTDILLDCSMLPKAALKKKFQSKFVKTRDIHDGRKFHQCFEIMCCNR